MLYIGIDPGQKGGIAVIEAQEGGRKASKVFPYTDGRPQGRLCRMRKGNGSLRG